MEKTEKMDLTEKMKDKKKKKKEKKGSMRWVEVRR